MNSKSEIFLKIEAVIGIILLIFTRFYRLGYDFVANDDFYFKDWSYVFMKELENGYFSKLPLTIQPGILTIYSNIIGYKTFYLLRDKLGYFVNLNDREINLALHTFNKIPQTTLIIILILLLVFLIKKVINGKVALLSLYLIAFEPMFIAHSRIIQTDMLQSLLMFNSLLVLLLYFKKRHKVLLILGGILGGLAFVEKSPSMILLAIIFILVLFEYLLARKDKIEPVKLSVISYIYYVFTFLITTILFYPPLWSFKINVIKRLFYDPIAFGAGYDAENYTYEKYVDSSFFSSQYFHYLFYRFSELFILGLVIFTAVAIIILIKKHTEIKHLLLNNKLYLYIIFYIFSWLFILQYSDKKFGRYFLIIAIPLTIFSSLGYKTFTDRLRIKYLFHIVLGLVLLFGVINYKNWSPDIILGYNNFYSSTISNEKITWDGGVGYLRLAEYLHKNYGTQKSLAIPREKGLVLYYDGKVKNASDINYSEDLIVDIKNNEKYLLNGYMLNDVYSIKSSPRFYIYQKK